MFRNEHVPLRVRQLKFKLDEDEDEQTVRQCEITFRLNGLLTIDAARGIADVPVAERCFGHDELPLWSLRDVIFSAPESEYQIDLRVALDLPNPQAVLEHVRIDRVRVFRPKKDHRDLLLDLVTVHALDRGVPQDLADLFNVWEGGSTFATFTAIRAPLLDVAEGTDPPRLTRGSKRTH